MKTQSHFLFLAFVSCASILMLSAARAEEPTADVKFAKKAAIDGIFEVQAGELAQKNAASDDVKEFGAMMVADHGKANDELKAIAEKKGIQLPAKLPKKLQAKLDKLSELQGEKFDSAYLKGMVKDHEKDLAEFQEEAKNGTDPEIKSFAEKTAAVIQKHLDKVKELEAAKQ